MDVIKQLKERKEQDAVNRRIVKALIPVRDDYAHKGNFGRVLIAAGSEGMCGAAVLAAKAAFRSGAGLVQVLIPRELFPIVQTGIPEATCVDRDTKKDFSAYDAVAMGPGLGQSESSAELVKRVLEEYKGALVLDADALNIISKLGCFDVLRKRAADYPTVITPHIGEAIRLLMAETPVEFEKEAYVAACEIIFTEGELRNMSKEVMAEALVKKTGCTVLLKGHDTIIARSLGVMEDEEIVEQVTNTTGNPGMATGGSGDVLTGIIASLMGQGLSAFDAARAGAYIHGTAGDLAAKKYGEAGLMAGDIAEFAAFAIKAIAE